MRTAKRWIEIFTQKTKKDVKNIIKQNFHCRFSLVTIPLVSVLIIKIKCRIHQVRNKMSMASFVIVSWNAYHLLESTTNTTGAVGSNLTPIQDKVDVYIVIRNLCY